MWPKRSGSIAVTAAGQTMPCMPGSCPQLRTVRYNWGSVSCGRSSSAPTLAAEKKISPMAIPARRDSRTGIGPRGNADFRSAPDVLVEPVDGASPRLGRGSLAVAFGRRVIEEAVHGVRIDMAFARYIRGLQRLLVIRP